MPYDGHSRRTLTESLSTLPRIVAYSKPLSFQRTVPMSAFTSFSGKTRAVTDDVAVREATFSEIPIISLSSPQSELVSQIKNACTRIGFFYVRDHGLSQDVIDAAFKCAAEFFALEREEKEEIHYKKSKILRGYEPPSEVRTDETKKADVNEAFNWGYAPELDPEAPSGGLHPGEPPSHSHLVKTTKKSGAKASDRANTECHERTKCLAVNPTLQTNTRSILQPNPHSRTTPHPSIRSSP